MHKLFALLSVVWLVSSPCLAETILVNGVQNSRTLTLKAGDHLDVKGSQNQVNVNAQGGTIDLHGEQNQLVVQGSLNHIEVHGSSNQLRCDAALGSLYLHGSRNQVRLIKRAGRPDPAVRKKGKSNTLIQENQP